MTLTELLATADYSGLSDAEAVAVVNTKRHAGDTYWTYRSLAGSTGIGVDATRRLVETMNAVSATDELVAEMRYSLRGERGINANDAGTQAMLDAFAANGSLALTEADAAAIKALADNQQSDAELHGLGRVEEKHIRWARQ